MSDHAVSDHPAVQAELDRLAALSPGTDILGLKRITRLLARLGDPHRHLPPVFHVAGTNGKGSTCAFLRAAIEADGRQVHVYTSPHLVRFNERIRIAGELIEDEALAALLAEVLDRAAGIGPSFFEVTTAAAFLAFARKSAAATIVEVGLGGRLDATNVVVDPAATGIAALGIDHQAFLGDTLEAIAGEKAGIAKPGVPLVTMRYPPPIAARVAAVADAAGSRVLAQGGAWHGGRTADRVSYADASGELHLPLPRMAGAFQADNLVLAAAMLRHQHRIALDPAALEHAALEARWPARMQRLGPGPLHDRLARRISGAELLLDGAHNVSAAAAVADAWHTSARKALVIGMLANKDASGVIDLLVGRGGVRQVISVPVPGHEHHAPEMLAELARAGGAAAGTADTLEHAIDLIDDRDSTLSALIAGSLYLAGNALRLNQELPK